MAKKYYVIANNDNTKFISRDETSGYPYVTDFLPFSLISGYDYISKYYEGMETYIKDASDFSIKEICLK